MMSDNPIIKEIERFTKITGGKQKEYYLQMMHDAHPVVVSSIFDVFTPQEVKSIMRLIKPQKKMCYKNSSLLTKSHITDKDVIYCEGKATIFGLSYDHAFNRVGDKYVDITSELACGNSIDDIQSNYYISLIECDENELADFELNSGVYGNVYAENFIIKNNLR